MAPTIWTESEIRKGFEKFLIENGHYPTAEEIDSVSYLPSARQIQRKFGGLTQLRKTLGLEITDYTRGNVRKNTAIKINNRGLEKEIELEGYLSDIFGEQFVHTEKRLVGLGKYRADFFIYTVDGTIAVDIFYPESIKILQRIINIKENKYSNYGNLFYYVCCNPEVTQADIERVVSNKVKSLGENFKIITLEEFKNEVLKFKPLRIAQEV